MTVVTLYGKPNCHLCEQALDVIRLVRARYPFELSLRNILESLDDYERFKHDIPVIFFEGVEIARHKLTEKQLLDALAARRSVGYNDATGAQP